MARLPATPVTKARVQSAAPGWPLKVVFPWLPLWWLLGVWQLMFLVMAIPMAIYLLRLRNISTPRGFWIWLLWLGWVLTGLLVLQVDAPGTVPGASYSRYLTFGFRFSWYIAATIVALYVLNTRQHLSAERISRYVAWFFVILIGGGLLGSLAPTLSLPSVLELLLPGGLAQQQFVQEIVHIQVAQVQDFLGDPQARPSAPFPYTNAWGLATAVSLPFFIVSWWRRGPTWRMAMTGILLVALYVIVSSVNRGMWIAILAMVVFVVARSIVLGRVRMLLVAVASTIVAVGLLLYSPLGDLVQARLDNPHSDQGRANLGLRAIESTAIGSPVVGFGTTRDVAGNFSSIAGGATVDCPKCEPPPLGTHGQLWLVTFGAGFVGAVLFLSFLIGQFVRNLGTRSPYSIAALCALIALVVTLPIYPSLEIPIYIGFIAIGLLAREANGPLPNLQRTIRPVLTHPMVLTLAALLGGLVGVGTHAIAGVPVEASQRLLVPAADLVPVPGARPFTLDAEAVLAKSDQVVRSVAHTMGTDPQEVREAIEIGAHPNSRVLIINYTAHDEERALRGVDLVTEAYLKERGIQLATSNRSVTSRHQAHLNQLDTTFRQTVALAPSSPGVVLSPVVADLRHESLKTAEILLDLSDSGVGRTISPASVAPSSDVGTVRVASGLSLGLLLGVPCAHLFHHRYVRLGPRPSKRLGLALPILTRVTELEVVQAAQLVHSVLPVANVAADPHSARSLRLALRLDERLAPHHRSGQRSLIVVESRSRVGIVRRLYDEQVRAGLTPVGLIICEPNRRRG